MKKILFILIGFFISIIACQKSISFHATDNGTEGPHGEDSTFTGSDTLTYEVITKDTGGWYGIWIDENTNFKSNSLDSVYYGSPVYFKSGWKYSFVPKHAPFQMMMSVDARNYVDDITINFYKNGALINTQTNSPVKGFAKLLMNVIDDDTTTGTATNPVVTYEVLLNNMDTTKFQYDGWFGTWNGLNENVNLANNPLVWNFAIPSGWRYSFHPYLLPFTMSMQTSPYTKGGGQVTINFYVNGKLVKTSAAYDLIYPPLTYDVL